MGPLSGLLVIDLTRALAGPHAGMMLGDLGARVIKVEQPGVGDDTRGWGPPFVEGESTYFMSCNRNKESVTLDLKVDEDRDVLERLIARADVLLENFRPGTLDRLGFGFERLHGVNPRLIQLSISGFGHDGPEGGRAGYDQIAQGEAGLMSLTGPDEGTPQRVGVPISDLLAGMYGAYGLLAAVIERQHTGIGQLVRTSLLAATVGVHAFEGTRWTVAGEIGHAQGNHHPSIAPYGYFRTADGGVQLAVGSEGLWRRFAPLVGLDPDDPRWATNTSRVADRAALTAEIEGAFASQTADDVLAAANAAGVPTGKVRSIDEVYSWEQTASQGLLIDVEHPVLGPVTLPGPPLRFFDGDGTEHTGRDHSAPPMLGQHNETVRRWLDESSGPATADGRADRSHDPEPQ